MTPYIHKVNYYETDRMQVTHHSNYVRFMEEARVYFLEEAGWGFDKMEADGIISPVTALTCEFKKTSTFADTIAVEISVEKCEGLKLVLAYRMTIDGTLIFCGTSTHCFLDVASGRPILLEKRYPELYQFLVNHLKKA